MQINNNKTQIVCISGATEAKVEASIDPGQAGAINSGESLKIVGFWFGSRPDVAVHVEKMMAKFYGRLWVL